MYKAKVAVCSEIRTKLKAKRAPCQTWWYAKKPLGFKSLSIPFRAFSYY